MANTGFFSWVAECCKVLGEPMSHGVNMMPETDPCWAFAYDDGLTPEKAVQEYLKVRDTPIGTFDEE